MAVVTLNDGDILTGSIYSTNAQDQWQLLGHVTGSTTNQALTNVASVTISGGLLTDASRIKVTTWGDVNINNGSYWYGAWISGAIGMVQLNHVGGAGDIAAGSRVVRKMHSDEIFLFAGQAFAGSAFMKRTLYTFDTALSNTPAHDFRTATPLASPWMSGLNVVQLWMATSGATGSYTYGALDVEVLRN